MYYNSMLNKWIIEPLDYFLLSGMLGRIIVSRLKDHLSEEKAMKRLKDSLIKECEKSMNNVDRPTYYYVKSEKVRRIFNFANSRGGDDYLLDQKKSSNNIIKLADSVRKIIENLAYVLKHKESTSLFKFFYKNARLVLELLLYQNNIEISYILMNGNQNCPEFIIISSVTGLISGVSLELQWCKVGALIFGIPTVLSVVLGNAIKSQVTYNLKSKALKEHNQRIKKKIGELMTNHESLQRPIIKYLTENPYPAHNTKKIKALNPTTYIEPVTHKAILDSKIVYKLKKQQELIEDAKVIRKMILPKKL